MMNWVEHLIGIWNKFLQVLHSFSNLLSSKLHFIVKIHLQKSSFKLNMYKTTNVAIIRNQGGIANKNKHSKETNNINILASSHAYCDMMKEENYILTRSAMLWGSVAWPRRARTRGFAASWQPLALAGVTRCWAPGFVSYLRVFPSMDCEN